MNLVPLKESDMDAVVLWESQCFGIPWTKEQVAFEFMSNPFFVGYQALENQDVVGYVIVWKTYEQAQISRIGILPKYQGKGLGKKMLECIKEQCWKMGCTSINLEVRSKNWAGIALYESCGFTHIHTVKDYYPDGSDAYVYEYKK